MNFGVVTGSGRVEVGGGQWQWVVVPYAVLARRVARAEMEMEMED